MLGHGGEIGTHEITQIASALLALLQSLCVGQPGRVLRSLDDSDAAMVMIMRREEHYVGMLPYAERESGRASILARVPTYPNVPLHEVTQPFVSEMARKPAHGRGFASAKEAAGHDVTCW
jgi:hypothetical protein